MKCFFHWKREQRGFSFPLVFKKKIKFHEILRRNSGYNLFKIDFANHLFCIFDNQPYTKKTIFPDITKRPSLIFF